MTRPPATPAVTSFREAFHADVVERVRRAIQEHDIVVVGMGWNPHVRFARQALQQRGLAHHYIEIGNYATGWRRRLALKLWAGWPTFPQVFVKGTLVGGNQRLRIGLEDGTVQQLLEGSAAESGVA